VQLHAAAAALLPHVRHAQVEQMAHLLKCMDETQHTLPTPKPNPKPTQQQSASRYMLKACSMRASVRLALVQHEEAGKALLFEAPRSLNGQGGSPRHRLVCDADLSADVVASSIGLSNTLLTSAINQQQARFICDCGTYMQSCVRPARDVFSSLSELVSAIVVVPLLAGSSSTPLGGIYFAVDTPCEFTNNQETLLGFIHGVTPMLHTRLAGQTASLITMVSNPKGNPRGAQAAAAHGSSSEGPSSAETGQTISGGDAAPSLASCSTEPSRHTPSGRLMKLSSNRLNTDAMLQVLQQDIRNKGRRNSLAGAGQDLVVGEMLGRGGFGCVYKGWWNKVSVAAKVMPSRATEREAMQDAVEMAVLSSIQHPNVVSVYSCLTDMVESGGECVCVCGCASMELVSGCLAARAWLLCCAPGPAVLSLEIWWFTDGSPVTLSRAPSSTLLTRHRQLWPQLLRRRQPDERQPAHAVPQAAPR